MQIMESVEFENRSAGFINKSFKLIQPFQCKDPTYKKDGVIYSVNVLPS